LLGLMTLTIQYTMGSTHMWNGVNYADAFNTVMTITGVGLLFFGAGVSVGVQRFRGMVNRLRIQERSA
jgi:hypothetical protein